jgi:hypothetical protein
MGTNFPSSRGPAKHCPYMSGDQKFLEPIMSNSETIIQFGNNAMGNQQMFEYPERNNYGKRIV